LRSNEPNIVQISLSVPTHFYFNLLVDSGQPSPRLSLALTATQERLAVGQLTSLVCRRNTKKVKNIRFTIQTGLVSYTILLTVGLQSDAQDGNSEVIKIIYQEDKTN